MVTSVPWQLASSVHKDLDRLRPSRCAARPARGPPARASGDREPKVATATVTRTAIGGRRPGSTAGRSSSRSGRSPTAGTASPAHRQGQVVFVRHALPGERVRAVVTEERKGFLRADAVEVLAAVARPGDAAVPVRRPGPLRRLRLPARRRWPRSASSRPPWCASSWPGSAGWTPARSTRWAYGSRALPRCRGSPTGWAGGPGCSTQWTATGRAGLLKHRSHEVVPVDRCRIAHPAVRGGDGAGAGVWPRWPGRASRWSRRPPARSRVLGSRGGRPADARSPGRAAVRERAVGREWRLPARGLLAGAPGRRRHAGRRRGGAARRRGRVSGPGTSTAGSGCSPPRWPRTWTATGPADRGRVRPGHARRAGAGEPGRPDHGDRARSPTWSGPWPTRAGARSTWSCSTRRGPGAGPAVVERDRRPAARGRWPTWPATRPRWPATCATFRDAGLAAGRAAGVRPASRMTHHVECVALLTRRERRRPGCETFASMVPMSCVRTVGAGRIDWQAMSAARRRRT